MHKQCVPGYFLPTHAREPGNEANTTPTGLVHTITLQNGSWEVATVHKRGKNCSTNYFTLGAGKGELCDGIKQLISVDLSTPAILCPLYPNLPYIRKSD